MKSKNRQVESIVSIQKQVSSSVRKLSSGIEYLVKDDEIIGQETKHHWPPYKGGVTQEHYLVHCYLKLFICKEHHLWPSACVAR